MTRVALFAITAIMLCLFSTKTFAEQYYITQLILSPTSGWCITTNAPPGEILMTVSIGKNTYSTGKKINKVNGESLLCSGVFVYNETWEKMFPIKITYDYGTPKAKEVNLNAFK